jgi:hypothetical protein
MFLDFTALQKFPNNTKFGKSKFHEGKSLHQPKSQQKSTEADRDILYRIYEKSYNIGNHVCGCSLIGSIILFDPLTIVLPWNTIQFS